MDAVPAKFYLRKTATVAKDLLGKWLVVKSKSGSKICRIVETEAYLGVTDPSAHSFGDKNTKRIQSMYKAGGHSYVYFIYGMYFCLNVATRKTGQPEAVLIRAVEIEGEADTRAGAGPGKLCRVLKITKEHDGLDMTKKSSAVWIGDAPKIKPRHIVTSSRIGLSHEDAKHWPLRFYVRDSLAVSKR